MLGLQLANINFTVILVSKPLSEVPSYPSMTLQTRLVYSMKHEYESDVNDVIDIFIDDSAMDVTIVAGLRHDYLRPVLILTHSRVSCILYQAETSIKAWAWFNLDIV